MLSSSFASSRAIWSLLLAAARPALNSGGIRRQFHSFGKLNKRFLNASEHFLKTRSIPDFTAGQPLHETRPHAIKAGDLTPGIAATEYFERRLRLVEGLAARSLVIVPGSVLKYASGAVFYKFQQNTDFYYLTGWNEPDSICILEKPTNNLEDVIFHLVVPPKNPNAEQWEGNRTGIEGAKEIFNADQVFPNDRFVNHLEKLIQKNQFIYYDSLENKNKNSNFFANFFQKSDDENKFVTTIESLLKKNNKNPHPISGIMTSLRVIKSNSELAVLRKAGEISGRAYNKAYANFFQNERTLASFLEYQFISGGCSGNAYIPVVAGGPNSLTIHYTRNDDIFHDGELVLVDAAGALGGYRADISRTWPVNGKFTPAQRDLYQALLNVQRHCISQCTELNQISLQGLHDISVKELTKELKNIGFAHLTEYETTKLYPHYIGHNLGLDVHDVPDYSRNKLLKKNQVITIEPGIYVPDDMRWPKHFRNLGIRIEDNIAIQRDSQINLTVEAAKEIVDIENIAQNGITTNYEEDVVDVLV
ncbi:hypothetical protein PACTADRAFT_83490 [Pachysolen tannophilus NRRL Y-2460]|uniref:Aminopeptidase P N-terminal domain-containing protein n=1 Tax=Pachysolen tannophilus NRRL Y-2460 TaxID=669874 RepID=A0A1E4U2E6_PACTA|nr:hypothetical protein PACTADRAFT_83490 [Pachysolen tannophilus NRRL Y-2460]